MRLVMLLFAALAAVAPAFSCETRVAEIAFDDGSYSFEFDALVDASAEAIEQVITAHEQLARINRNIVEARVLEHYDETTLKRLLRIERCVLSFCFKLIFVEHVETQPLQLTTTIIPEQSNYLAGVINWYVLPLTENQSRLKLSASQTPDFWIPPVLGPLVLKHVFVQELEATCEHIETVIADSRINP